MTKTPDNQQDNLLSVNVLDCTLRDGGYYNDWDFDGGLVDRYLHGIVQSGVQYLELGFRSPDKQGFAGRFKYCTDDLIDRIVPENAPRIAVMIDGLEFVTRDGVVDRKSLARLFISSDKSRVEMVRVTATQSTIGDAVQIAEVLKDLGYHISVNLMRASLLSDQDLIEAAKALETSPVDVMYLADSFGGLGPVRVGEVFKILKDNFSRQTGFHGHDNMGLALANSIAANDSGVDMIDCSLSGMGRGAGNLSTERFLLYLRFQRQMNEFDVAPLVDVVTSDFSELQDRYRWGSSLPYMLSGVYNLHPMYAQHLLQGVRYAPADVIRTLETLHRNGSGGSFDPANLTQAIRDRYSKVTSPVPVEDLRGFREGLPLFQSNPTLGPVLLLASGPSLGRHKDAINEFIRKRNPLVVECNAHDEIEAGENHVCVFTNSRRLKQFSHVVVRSRARLLLGVPVVDRDVADLLNDKEVYRYSCEVREGQFQSSNSGSVIPHDVVTMGALAFCLQMNPGTIFLCGVDGYASEAAETDSLSWSERAALDEEMHEFFRLLKESKSASETKLISLTPTTFDLETESLYAYL